MDKMLVSNDTSNNTMCCATPTPSLLGQRKRKQQHPVPQLRFIVEEDDSDYDDDDILDDFVIDISSPARNRYHKKKRRFLYESLSRLQIGGNDSNNNDSPSSNKANNNKGSVSPVNLQRIRHLQKIGGEMYSEDCVVTGFFNIDNGLMSLSVNDDDNNNAKSPFLSGRTTRSTNNTPNKCRSLMIFTSNNNSSGSSMRRANTSSSNTTRYRAHVSSKASNTSTFNRSGSPNERQQFMLYNNINLKFFTEKPRAQSEMALIPYQSPLFFNFLRLTAPARSLSTTDDCNNNIPMMPSAHKGNIVIDMEDLAACAMDINNNDDSNATTGRVDFVVQFVNRDPLFTTGPVSSANSSVKFEMVDE
eukprot:GEZU01007864.1.p1 GENE.GEZU01007864.1~~GEZU01007864.1.p1  ORF type:complete len:360 (-),score=89.33 GEZU01007864.1:168-1247(-)